MLTNRQLFQQHIAQTSTAPLQLEIEKAEGVYMYGSDNKKYLDLISGIAVSNVGHRHPAVLQAIQNQLDKYMHLMVYGEFIQGPQAQLAERLTRSLHDSLDNVYFVNSGSEAVEGALKLAKRYTGRAEIVSAVNAYHGSTHGALSVTGNEDLKRNFRPLVPGISHLRHGNPEDFEQITTKTAAVIIEIVQGEAGVRAAQKDYFVALKNRCTETGTLLIVDEIQTGFGRTGTFWLHEQYNFTPDMVVCAKGMGGGMPVGAFIAPKRIMSELTDRPVLGHITTFGGHPVSCAASCATFDLIYNQPLLHNVKRKEQRFIDQLSQLSTIEIRHHGLLMALQFDSFERLQKIISSALEEGILTDWFLFCDDALRIAPPLTISEEEIDSCCEGLIRAIKRHL